MNVTPQMDHLMHKLKFNGRARCPQRAGFPFPGALNFGALGQHALPPLRGLVKIMLLCLLIAPIANAQSSRIPLFDGKSLEGWEKLKDDRHLWRVEDNLITGGSLTEKVPHNSFLSTKQSFHNFDLRLKIRIKGTEGFINSGVQIRSVRVSGSHEMSGYQVDAGNGWWGKLYDESRRNKVIGEAANLDAVNRAVKPTGWNEYRILAEGPRIRSWINGVLALDYTETDPNIAQDGYIGIQVHGGGKALVQVSDVSIKELPATLDAPTWKKIKLKSSFPQKSK